MCIAGIRSKHIEAIQQIGVRAVIAHDLKRSTDSITVMGTERHNSLSGEIVLRKKGCHRLGNGIPPDWKSRINHAIAGSVDGESAVKESSDIVAERCFFNLRYPFWHVHRLDIRDCRISEGCRAALWYSEHVAVEGSKLHGIKAFRECRDVSIRNCDIKSGEFGWFSHDFVMEDCTVESDYFMLRATNLAFSKVRFKGKYALQYLHDSVFDHCDITSRDAFWHVHNVTVKNSVLRGEFLGWYSCNLTLENCRILSSQPLCYCNALKLIDCELVDSDLCFEKSDVDAVSTTPVDSIKNPRSGRIVAPFVEEIIRDDEHSRAEILVTGQSAKPGAGAYKDGINSMLKESLYTE